MLHVQSISHGWVPPVSPTLSRCAFTHAATASSLLEHFGWNKVIGIYAENCGSNRHRRCNHQCVQALLLVLPTDIPGLWSPASMPLHTGVNSYLYCFESFCNNPVVSEGSCNNTAGHSLFVMLSREEVAVTERGSESQAHTQHGPVLALRNLAAWEPCRA